MADLTVIYDACVLYPAPLRDLLMHLAMAGIFRARWTDRIHEEWIGALLKNRPDLTRAQLERTRRLMNAHVLDALVTGFEALEEGLVLPDPGDRHVLAAAIKAGASVILTFNLDDFPAAALEVFQLKAQHPDRFIAEQIDAYPAAVCSAVRRHRGTLRHPKKSVDDYFAALVVQRLPETVAGLRPFSKLL